MTLDLSDPLLEGQELQVGFDSSSSGYDNTGVYYDNVSISFSSGNGGGGDPVNEDEGEYVLPCSNATIVIIGVNWNRHILQNLQVRL